MKTVVLGQPPELTQWLQRRRALGQDRFDEMWEGDYHVAPARRFGHGHVAAQLLQLLTPHGQAAGLVATTEFNLGTSPDSYRVPDAGFHRQPPSPDTIYLPTAVVVVEVLSPGDETYEKFDFYAQRGVEELVVADPERRRVEFYRLRPHGAYEPVSDSAHLGVAADDLSERLAWPA